MSELININVGEFRAKSSTIYSSLAYLTDVFNYYSEGSKTVFAESSSAFLDKLSECNDSLTHTAHPSLTDELNSYNNTLNTIVTEFEQVDKKTLV